MNRIEKVLEDANIKLASVASHVLGQSGRTMLRAMVHGILDPNKLAEMAKAKLRNKIPELRLAFGARFEERHRFQMQELLDQMHFLDDKVAEFAQQIEQRSQPWNEHIQPPNILPPGPEFVPATKRVPVNATAAKRAKLPLAPASSASGLDLNRNIGQPKKITTIFGRKVTKQYEGKLPSVIEDLDLPNRVIRSHYGHGFAKQYVRDDRLRRTEPAANNVYDYGVQKDVEKPSLTSPEHVSDRRQLPRRPAGCPGDLNRPGPTAETRRAHDPFKRKPDARPQARSVAATCGDGFAGALRKRGRRRKIQPQPISTSLP